MGKSRRPLSTAPSPPVGLLAVLRVMVGSGLPQAQDVHQAFQARRTAADAQQGPRRPPFAKGPLGLADEGHECPYLPGVARSGYGLDEEHSNVRRVEAERGKPVHEL